MGRHFLWERLKRGRAALPLLSSVLFSVPAMKLSARLICYLPNMVKLLFTMLTTLTTIHRSKGVGGQREKQKVCILQKAITLSLLQSLSNARAHARMHTRTHNTHTECQLTYINTEYFNVFFLHFFVSIRPKQCVWFKRLNATECLWISYTVSKRSTACGI